MCITQIHSHSFSISLSAGQNVAPGVTQNNVKTKNISSSSLAIENHKEPLPMEKQQQQQQKQQQQQRHDYDDVGYDVIRESVIIGKKLLPDYSTIDDAVNEKSAACAGPGGVSSQAGPEKKKLPDYEEVGPFVPPREITTESAITTTADLTPSVAASGPSTTNTDPADNGGNDPPKPIPLYSVVDVQVKRQRKMSEENMTADTPPPCSAQVEDCGTAERQPSELYDLLNGTLPPPLPQRTDKEDYKELFSGEEEEKQEDAERADSYPTEHHHNTEGNGS